MSDGTQRPELALPWTAVANSWQYTTIYDALDVPVCRFDLEDWGVDEDNQSKLEARQAAVSAHVIRAVAAYDDMLTALKNVRSLYRSLTSDTDAIAVAMLAEIDAAMLKARGASDA